MLVRKEKGSEEPVNRRLIPDPNHVGSFRRARLSATWVGNLLVFFLLRGGHNPDLLDNVGAHSLKPTCITYLQEACCPFEYLDMLGGQAFLTVAPTVSTPAASWPPPSTGFGSRLKARGSPLFSEDPWPALEPADTIMSSFCL